MSRDGAVAVAEEVEDTRGRPLATLRLSVTDRCNLRCRYCMPEASYAWLPRNDILSFEECLRLARVFARCGVRRLRLTGGEPLLRRGLPDLVGRLRALEAFEDIGLTTNGVLLAKYAQGLADAGLSRLTISLDAVEAAQQRAIAGSHRMDKVLAGLHAARAVGLGRGLKLNAVIMRGLNDDQIVPLLELGKRFAAEVRFIEYMDVGGATRWQPRRVFSRAAILEQIGRRFGTAQPVGGRGAAPAERFRLPDGTVFGIIASTTQPFCGACDRSRITADGRWLTCLYASDGPDLRQHLRDPRFDDADLEAFVRTHWQHRRDAGAEERRNLSSQDRGPAYSLVQLRRQPHLEMHTRGG